MPGFGLGGLDAVIKTDPPLKLSSDFFFLFSFGWSWGFFALLIS